MGHAKKILKFLSGLVNDLPKDIFSDLPEGIRVMNPYENPTILKYCQAFYQKYYQDYRQRTLIIGINPGRHGAGLTGIPFTDPISLSTICGIPNKMKKQRELSGEFIYQMIARYGNPTLFYSRFYFTSAFPLGFIKDGKNMNYYDSQVLQKKITPWILKTLRLQIDFGMNTDIAYCLGKGKNAKMLTALNDKYHLFKKIIPLAHPRFIMQYQRKALQQHIQEYIDILKK